MTAWRSASGIISARSDRTPATGSRNAAVTTAGNTRSDARFHVIDGMRGVAAICVMIFHYLILTNQLKDHSTTLFTNAWTAVDLFFVISGFVLWHSYQNQITHGLTFSHYIRQRAVRLYPCAVLSVVFGLGAVVLLKQSHGFYLSYRAILRASLTNLLLIPYLHEPISHDYFPTNPPLWSLFFEILASLYLFFAARFDPRHIKTALIGLVVITMLVGLANGVADKTYLVNIDVGWNTATLLPGLPRLLLGFTFGMFIHAVLHIKTALPAWMIGLGRVRIGSLGCYGLTVIALVAPWHLMGFASVLNVLVIMPILVMCAALARAETAAERGLAAALGGLSYPLYCLHWPIFYVAQSVFRDRYPGLIETDGIGFILDVATLSLLTAALVARFYDAPVRVWLRGVLLSPAAPPTPR